MTSRPNKWSVYLLLIPPTARSAAMESYLREVGEHFSFQRGEKMFASNCPVANPRGELAMHVTRIKLVMDAPQVRCNTSAGYLPTDL